MENSLLMGIFNIFLCVYQRVNQPSLPNWEVSDSYLPHHGDASRGLSAQEKPRLWRMMSSHLALNSEAW
jgi:hypothetical protein